jgi:hypothetical protein
VTVVDWFFRNRRTGEITVAQAPNLPIIVFFVAWVLRWLLSPAGIVLRALDVVVVGSLAWWAVDELFRGVNPWRRTLGAIVLLALGTRLVR